ncbi:hypothetical protein PSPO01_15196 [Paraphaeosphaeria sporulosa]
MPRIHGWIQAAMVLKDALFTNMTFEQWSQVVNPKVQGTWNLHQTSSSDMDFFVLLSSFAGVIGHTGQSNYRVVNTYEDAFAHYRSAKGEKTISIDLGVVLGEGFVTENDKVMDRLMRLNIPGQTVWTTYSLQWIIAAIQSRERCRHCTARSLPASNCHWTAMAWSLW